MGTHGYNECSHIHYMQANRTEKRHSRISTASQQQRRMCLSMGNMRVANFSEHLKADPARRHPNNQQKNVPRGVINEVNPLGFLPVMVPRATEASLMRYCPTAYSLAPNRGIIWTTGDCGPGGDPFSNPVAPNPQTEDGDEGGGFPREAIATRPRRCPFPGEQLRAEPLLQPGPRLA